MASIIYYLKLTKLKENSNNKKQPTKIRYLSISKSKQGNSLILSLLTFC